MTLRIGFAYNEAPSEEDEPPSIPATGMFHDRYAEWDSPATLDAVAAALAKAGDVIRLEADLDFPTQLRSTRPDIVFNIAEGLHGPNREAHIPAICEFLGIPYTGSDPLTLGLALEKRRAKEVFAARGIATPRHVVLEGGDASGDLPLTLPVIVKPLFEGSSKGIDRDSLCRTLPEVRRRAAELAETYRQPSLVEEFLPGREFTCAILGNGASARALPLVEVRFDALPAGAPPIYGWEAKWLWDTVEAPLPIFQCPADLDVAAEEATVAVALSAYHALGCRDWGRVDLRMDVDGRPHVLEVNPLPGILPDPRQNSCFPKAARAAGMEYDDLIRTVLDAALARCGVRA